MARIGTKILLVVGIVFILFSIGLAGMIGATSFSNLTQVKRAELNRTSQILASQIAQLERNAALAARRFEESEPIVSELQLLTDLGPYYADPGSYFEADFMDSGGEIENADKIYVFQSQLRLLQLLLPTQQINNFSSIRFYLLSPFTVVPEAKPALVLDLGQEEIVVGQFNHKGANISPRYYTIPTEAFQPPAPDYFGISSAYAFPPEDFYRENHFDLVNGSLQQATYTREWADVSVPQSEVVLTGDVPLLQTWYPVRVFMPHPETWAEELVSVGIVQIEQRLDGAAVALLSEQLGLDIGLARGDQLLVTSLRLDPSNLATQRIDNIASNAANDATVTLDQNVFNYAWKAIEFANNDANLQAVVLSPVSELAGLTGALRRQIVQVSIITVLLAGIIIYLTLLYLLNRPLGALMDGVQRISRGELSHSVNVGSKDEVGQLAIAFNSMASQLRDLFGSLEQRVSDRTQELTEANRAAQTALQKAEKANQAKSEFLSQMSHELRTPLNGILGYTQILRKNNDLNTQQINGLTVIHQSGEHLLTLINDILDMAKIEAQKLELFPAPVHLPSFLDALVRIFRFRAEQKGLAFTYEMIGRDPFSSTYTIQVDEKRLRQIIINLLSNAIRYTETGNVTFRVANLDETLTQAETGETVDRSVEQPIALTLRFAVEDTGVGLTHAEIEHLFTPFEQLGKPQQREKGTGLGLAISQNLAQMMQSHIEMKSEPGVGSTFWFDLTVPLLSTLPPPQAPSHRVITGYRGVQRTILAVDDNQNNRRLLADLLTPLGFQVQEALNGEEAIDLVRQVNPDLVLMDLRMAGLSGLEATKMIRQQSNGGNESLCAQPRSGAPVRSPASFDNLSQREAEQVRAGPIIIAASASAFDKDRAESLAAGCDGFLAKPVHTPELFQLLEMHLNLTWIYADEVNHVPALLGERKGAPAQGFVPGTQAITPMIIPPPDEVERLLSLAQRGMMRGIRERAQHLMELDEAYAPFATRLGELAQGFQEKALLALMQEASSANISSSGLDGQPQHNILGSGLDGQPQHNILGSGLDGQPQHDILGSGLDGQPHDGRGEMGEN